MSKPTQTKVYDPRAERVLFDALRGKVRGRTELVKLTRADAVALTGLPSEQAEPALKSLVKTYRSHLAVTDDGDLVYAFDPSLDRRDKVPLSERVRALGQVAWRGFQFLFKIWIVFTLIAYVVAFVAMMLALMFSRSSNDRDDRRGGGGGMFWLWYWLMPDMMPQPVDRYGRPIRRVVDDRPKKRFYLSVFDFVFGPKGKPVDPRESDKRLLAFLRDNKGRVTAAELVALTGLSLDAADEELTRLSVEYDGEVEVAEDGTLIYVFRDLLTSAESAGTWWRYAWDANEPQPTLTGNTPGTNLAIGGFAGFNLLASMTIGPAFLQRVHLSGDPIATFFVTLFPLLFSLVFFAVPGIRLLQKRRADRKRANRRVRSELLREIWSHADQSFDPVALSQIVAERAQQPIELVRKSLERLLADLEGDVETDADGKLRYRFPRLVEEKRAVGKARAEASDEPRLGEVIFSSEDEPQVGKH